MNTARRAGLPRASWILAVAALGGLLTALAIASGGSTTSAASPCDASSATEPCGTGDRVVDRQALTNKLFAVQVACDSCVLGGNPSPTATATATSSVEPTGTSEATASPSPSPSTTTSPTATATATTTPGSPTPTASPTQPADTCEESAVLVVALDKIGNPESVSIYGNGPLDGWYIVSAEGGERFDFPEGFVIDGLLQVTSGAAAVNDPPAMLRWTSSEVWDDSADDNAMLYDCVGNLRSNFDDGF